MLFQKESETASNTFSKRIRDIKHQLLKKNQPNISFLKIETASISLSLILDKASIFFQKESETTSISFQKEAETASNSFLEILDKARIFSKKEQKEQVLVFRYSFSEILDKASIMF